MEESECERKLVLETGVEIINLYKKLIFNKKEYVISRKILEGIDIGIKYCRDEYKTAYYKTVYVRFWLELLLLVDKSNLEMVLELRKKLLIISSILEKKLKKNIRR